MKEGLSGLQALETEVMLRAKAKKDFVVNTGSLHVETSSGVPMLVVGDKKNVYDINRVAHRQIQGHLKIPADYYDRMLAEDPQLLAYNINTWLHKNRENRLVRILFGTTRSFLSDRYRPLEHEDLAEAVLPPLRELGVAVMSSQITDTKLYIKAVDQRVVRELAKVNARFGDGQHKIVRVASPAITITNSEVGMGALSVLAGVYDKFCSNLATFDERSMRKYHVGGKHELGEDVYSMLTDETRRKTDAALWAQITDIVKGAFERARFDSLCDKIEDTAKDKIEGDVVKVVSFATKKFNMTEGEGSIVLKKFVEGGDLSRFGLYNAVTAASADLPEYDRASEFERIGGQIIELPCEQWKEMAAAA